MPNAKLLNSLHLHGIVFIWGFTAVLGALISIDAIPLVWIRMLLASGFILLFVLLKKEKLRFSVKTLSRFFLAGFIIALHWLCFFGAIKESNVSVTLAIMSTGAFFASLLEPLFYRRKIIGYEVFFGIIVISGLYLIFNVETDYIWGIGLALASSFLGAVFTIINGALVVKHKASVISLYELFFGGLCITAYLAFQGKITSELFQLSTNDWLLLLLLASVCTAYAFLASVHVMKWISPYTVMLTVNLEPVYGIILALLILGDSEHMKTEFYYGAVIIIVTVIANGIIKNRLQRKKRRLPNT
ncbi:DMT family transporter [uncultured Marixanthomonas sp.]|mgnify:FL=1|uniref:DMT family transporter n=1 Tax=uncultured Marixanthomonas sp. TaxID=757245 RepID=UPI0030DB225D|tara:strand:- start:11436 stop:12338 length:903 start_codon:yes stop_codon:yes gene_type:complete